MAHKQYLTNVVFPGVAWASVAVTVTTVSVTQAASTAPANSPGNVTARRAGAGSSATRVSLLRYLLLCLHSICSPCFMYYLLMLLLVGVSRSELLHTP